MSCDVAVRTAPEVLEDPSNGCAASNVYSFGVILWELCARKVRAEI